MRKLSIEVNGFLTTLRAVRTVFRLTALLVALLTLALWWHGGFHRGWTKTSVSREQLDPVTGISAPMWEKKFVPGVDFLGGGAFAATVLLGCSFLCRKKASAPASPAP